MRFYSFQVLCSEAGRGPWELLGDWVVVSAGCLDVRLSLMFIGPQVRFYGFQFLCSELAEETQELLECLGDLLDLMPDGGVFTA